jgi:hypothetical protein
MRLPEDPGFPVVPPAQPTRDLLLAQALDACITAERRRPGSAQGIIARQPAWARADLQRLVGLAGSLDAAASNAIMSSEFRVAARARLMHRIGAAPGVSGGQAPHAPVRLTALSGGLREPTFHPRKTFWRWRATAGALAGVLTVAATLTASASALPGEPLYSLKQAQEELGVRLAADDQQRALALLRRADARLEETARLLQLGRTVDASETTQRYDQVLERAMSSYVVTVEDVPQPAPATVHMDARLSQEQDQLRSMLQSAPEQARPDLREALVATERGRALVADPRPVVRALGGADRHESAEAVALPTTAVDDSPTVLPTVPPMKPTALALQRPLIALPTATPAVVVADAQPPEQNTTLTVVDRGRAPAGGGANRASAPPPPARSAPAGDQTANQHVGDEAPVLPSVVVAHGDRKDTSDSGVDVAMHGDGSVQAVDRTNLAALINGRLVPTQGGGSDGHAADARAEADPLRVRGEGVPQPTVAQATPEPTNDDRHGVVAGTGGRTSGGDGGTGGAPRTVPAQVVSPPERASTDTTNSTNRGGTQHPTHDASAEVHATSAPTATTTTNPTKVQPAPAPTPMAHHNDAPEPTRGESPRKPSPSPASAPIPHPSAQPHH